MTAEELLGLSIPGKKHELVDGIVVEMEPPGAEHGWVTNEIIVLLSEHVRARGLGRVFPEIGYLLASVPDVVLAPDVSFVRQARVDEVGRTPRYWPGPPDLAVEIVSPGDRWTDVERKALRWLDAGTGAVLIIDPPLRTATVFRGAREVARHTAGDRVELGDVVPDWAPLLDELLG